MRRPLNMSYLKIGEAVQEVVGSELGITVSVGIGPTKVLSKVASKWNKPKGLVYIHRSEIDEYLAKLPVGKI